MTTGRPREIVAAHPEDATSPRETAAALLKRAGVALEELSRAKGAEHEVFASHEIELKAVYDHDDFSVSASNEGSEFGIRTIEEGRLGFVTTNSDSDDALRLINLNFVNNETFFNFSCYETLE